MNKIPKSVQIGEYEYELFVPTVFRPYKIWFQDMYLKRYIRLLFQAIRGSIIFYMKDSSGRVLGYIHLERGNSRYPWTAKKDWVISPYAINKEHQGQGIGSILIRDFRENLLQYITGEIYAVTNSVNQASIRVLEKNGFEFIGYAVLLEKGVRKYIIVPQKSANKVYKMGRFNEMYRK